MNGAHDLGGQHGLGAINPEAETDEPVFHAEWERRVFALTLATGMLGQWNIDQARFARERQHPVEYLSNSYYENWLAGLETLLRESALLEDGSGIGLRPVTPAGAVQILQTGGPSSLANTQPPRFKIGAKVKVRNMHMPGHTRAPRYAQGAEGIIAAAHGCHIFPDQHSRQRKIGEHLYTVSFQARALWGQASSNVEVMLDLWEPYLECVQP